MSKRAPESDHPQARGLGRTSLLEHYALYYDPEIEDLSCSAAPPLELPVADGAALDYVPPRGAPELRAAIAGRYKRISPDQVVLSSGASEMLVAIAHAFKPRCAAVDAGVYESFLAAAARLGALLIEADADEPAGEHPDLTILCNPTVPDGRLRTLRRPTAGRLVVDEVELDFLFVPARGDRAADAIAGAISVNSLSKSLGLGGLRLGWAVCRDEDALDALDREVQLLSGGPAAPSVAAAEEALARYDGAVGATNAAVESNAPRIYEILQRAGWRWPEPEAGLTIEATPPSPPSETFLEELRAAGLFMVPGTVYGRPQTFRVSLLASPAALERACAIAASHSGPPCEPNATRPLSRSRVRDSGLPTLAVRPRGAGSKAKESDMCVSCNCGKPMEQHGDNRNITLSQIEQAAQAANCSPQEVAASIQRAVGGQGK